MDNKANIEIRLLRLEELDGAALQYFNRHQVTNRVKYLVDGQYLFKDEHFVETWDEGKKRRVADELRSCIAAGGFACGAFVNRRLIGFANVENKFFGRNKEYLELPYIHISCEYRGQGLGKQLFRLCCEKAKTLGAGKLYISTHPAEETQNFYMTMGCVPAMEVIKEIYDREPLDIQLEVTLKQILLTDGGKK